MATENNRIQNFSEVAELTAIETFPTDTTLQTQEQVQRFELLRLAFFALKLRKLTQAEPELEPEPERSFKDEKAKRFEMQCSLLRHAIFQQVVTLIKLDARDQAFQILKACRI